MSQSLIGSRYDTHIAKKGTQESKDFVVKGVIVPASLGNEVGLPHCRLFQCGLKQCRNLFPSL